MYLPRRIIVMITKMMISIMIVIIMTVTTITIMKTTAIRIMIIIIAFERDSHGFIILRRPLACA